MSLDNLDKDEENIVEIGSRGYKSNLYGIYDNVGCMYTRIFVCPSNPVAVRMFYDSEDDGSFMRRHATDFDLYLLGAFDEVTGYVLPHTINDQYAPQKLASLSDML